MKLSCPKCGHAKMGRCGSTDDHRAARYRCSQCRFKTTKPGSAKPVEPEMKKVVEKARRYIITGAQNATPVHKSFWASLLVAAKALKAEIIVIPLRYRNPTSLWSSSAQGDLTWAKEVLPYLFNGRLAINQNLRVLADLKTVPTAASPLTGMEGLTGRESCIVGHTKVQLVVVPVPAGRTPKILATTGACTVPNFTDSKAGKLGAFHHTLGALVVETSGKTFHLRHVSASKDGSFTDLDKSYSPEGMSDAPPALGLIMGDTHVKFVCPSVVDATFGRGGIVETLNPNTLVWHDVLDAYAVNHHHNDNPFIKQAKHRSGFGNVRREVEETIAFVDKHTGNRKSVIVDSNHTSFLSRWVVSADWRDDAENAAFYLETASAMLASTKMSKSGTEYDDPFKHWVRKISRNKNVRCLGSDESLTLAGIECGLHGDRGPNGSRGSAKSLSRLGTRVVIGHSHTPRIQDGAWQTGTSTPLRLEYNNGPSSWLNAHVVIYASGKRALLIMLDGRWRL